MKHFKSLTLSALIAVFLCIGSNGLAADTTKSHSGDTTKTKPPKAQFDNYSIHALGIRAVGTTGLTYKHFSSKGNAFEAILGFGYNSFSITGLSEKYAAAFQSDYVDMYYGLGGHAVFSSNSNFGTDRNRFRNSDDSFGLGIDFILGLEFQIPETPLALSADIKPFFEVATSGNAYVGLDPGFGIKIFF